MPHTAVRVVAHPNEALARAAVAVEVNDSVWPVVVVRTGQQPGSGKPLRLLFGLDRVLERGEQFGLVFDLLGAARGAGTLVDTALAQRATSMAARCVGVATVSPRSPGSRRRLAEHPVLFPFRHRPLRR
jgi:hypothetical protein